MSERYQKAMREAMTSAGREVILHTLAFYHPSFKDSLGNHVTVYLVNDMQNFYAPLEDTALNDAGRWVEFIACAFEVTPPQDDDSSNPQVSVAVDNVARTLMPWLLKATQSNSTGVVTYRPYIAGLPELGPQVTKPYPLIIRDVNITGSRTSMTASMEDIASRKFLHKIITADTFPSLGAL